MEDELQKNINLAVKHLQIADHMAYVTFPLVNDKRLLLKIFEETYNSIMNLINSMILHENPSKNLNETNEFYIKAFLNKFSKEYNLTAEKIKKISEIIAISKRHKESAMEFVRKNNVVIMSDSLKIQALNINKVKEYLLLAKELVISINDRIKKKKFVIS